MPRADANPSGSHDLRRWTSLTGPAPAGLEWKFGTDGRRTHLTRGVRASSSRPVGTCSRPVDARFSGSTADPPGGTFGRFSSNQESVRPDSAGAWGPVQVGGVAAAIARYRSATSSRLSGITRTPATEDMKLRSPDHLGTTWTCRCWGSPAPAASPWFTPILTPWGSKVRSTRSVAKSTRLQRAARSSGEWSSNRGRAAPRAISRWPLA